MGKAYFDKENLQDLSIELSKYYNERMTFELNQIYFLSAGWYL